MLNNIIIIIIWNKQNDNGIVLMNIELVGSVHYGEITHLLLRELLNIFSI